MLGEQKLKQIAKKVLSLSHADESEVLLMVSKNGLTRFANTQIHQNMAWEDLGISVRSVFGKKIGVASGNSFEHKELKYVVQRSEELAKLQKEDKFFVSLPHLEKIPSIATSVVFTPAEKRAQAVSIILKKSKASSITASGAYSSTVSEIAVMNSYGVWAYHTSSASDLSTILLGDTSTGFASQVGKGGKDIDAEAVVDRAIEKVQKGTHPISVKPGEWDVILEPQAVNEIMSFFSWLGPNARIYHEQASCYSGMLGKKVAGKNVTLIDDPLHKDAFPMPFDFEGTPKRKLEIIKNGVLKNLVYDSYLSNRFKATNTGHALPAPNTMGGIPLHLAFEPGKKSGKEMIRSIKKGLLVTRFWYVRVLNNRQLSLTGMTRDGVFLIEDGVMTKGIKNMRFNQSVPQMLNTIVEVGKKLYPVSSFETEIGVNRMPYLHVKNWNFSSATLF